MPKYSWLTILPLVVGTGCGSDPLNSPPVASTLQLASGDGQSGTPGYRLPAEVVVRLVDQHGAPVVGTTITFASAVPGSAPEPLTALTDADGYARTMWRLGSNLGAHTLVATAAGNDGLTRQIAATAGSASPRSITGGLPGLCVVTAEGVLRCGLPPQLGSPDPAPWHTIGGSTRFLEAVLVDDTAPGMKGCAIAESGRIWCFRLAADATVEQLEELSGTYPSLHGLSGSGVATNAPAYCGLSGQGEAWCWGRNTNNLLGTATFGTVVTPTPVNTAVRFASIEVGWENSCAITATGEAWCWGRNRQGQTGSTPPSGDPFPHQIPTPVRFARLALGDWEETACGVAIEGGLWCWGQGRDMRGPQVTSPIGPVPVAIPGRGSARDLTQVGFALITLNQDRSGSAWGGLSFVEPATVSTEFVDFPSVPITSLTNRTGRDVICGPVAGATGTLCVLARELVVAKYPGGGARPAVFGIPLE